MSELMAYFQFVAMVAAVAAIFIHIGHRDQQLNSLASSVDELKSIVADLLKAQITATTNVTHAQRMIDDLSRRIEHLEHNRCTHCGAATVEGGR